MGKGFFDESHVWMRLTSGLIRCSGLGDEDSTSVSSVLPRIMKPSDNE